MAESSDIDRLAVDTVTPEIREGLHPKNFEFKQFGNSVPIAEQAKRSPLLSGIPGRIFLDTSVVNFILDHGEQIHDNVPLPEGIGEHDRRDIDALYNIFLTGARAMWQLAISPHTYAEVIRTRDPLRCHYLESWFFKIWQYWHGLVQQNNDLPSFLEAEKQRVVLLASGQFDSFPDLADRILLCDAIVYRCDLFCTRDWKTILKRRHDFDCLPIEIISPHEWWFRIRAHAGLWV